MWAIPYLDGEPDLGRLVKIFRAMRYKGVKFTVVEEQHVFYKQGAVSAWTNSAGYMAIKACLAWSGIPYAILKPEVWKREMNLPAKKVQAKLPPRPLTKSKKKQEAWEKACKKAKDRALNKTKKARKDVSCATAQRMQPGYDFRSSPRARKPHDGKCEAFLLSVIAYRRR